MKSKNYMYYAVIILFAALIIIPLLTLFVWSVTERWVWPYIIPKSFSLRAVKDVAAKLRKPGGIFVSGIILSLITAFLSVAISLLTARAILFYKFIGRNFVLFTSILPFLVPVSVFAMGVQVIFIMLGLNNTFHGVMAAHLIYSLPYSLRLIIDAMAAIGDKYEVQARVLGASGLKAFICISCPMLLPVALSAFGIAYIISFSQYFLTLLIGGGRVVTFTIVMVPYLSSGNRNFASAYSLVFLGITLFIFIIIDRLAKLLNKQLSTQLY